LISNRDVQGKWKEVIGETSKLSQVLAVYDITGDIDLVCIYYFKDRNELDEFLKNQLQLPHVERVLTNMVLNVCKDERRTILPSIP
jgi:DNA-binding Lrp family transcriptional regulator